MSYWKDERKNPFIPCCIRVLKSIKFPFIAFYAPKTIIVCKMSGKYYLWKRTFEIFKRIKIKCFFFNYHLNAENNYSYFINLLARSDEWYCMVEGIKNWLEFTDIFLVRCEHINIYETITLHTALWPFIQYETIWNIIANNIFEFE